MMAGLLIASIVTGQLVSKGWRYRPFPILGTAVMTIGLGLFGTIGVATSELTLGFFMLILGTGLGLVMQISSPRYRTRCNTKTSAPRRPARISFGRSEDRSAPPCSARCT